MIITTTMTSLPFCGFPTGVSGYQVKKDLKLSPLKYFNQRLSNYTQRFASDPDYKFLNLSLTQDLKLQIQINITMKKVAIQLLKFRLKTFLKESSHLLPMTKLTIS